MNCGIHQGWHHYLLNYVTFIKSLLIELNKSNLSIKISEIGCTLIGYADDMSAVTTSKNKMDKVMSIVGNHGGRYECNACKSAVLLYGESRKEWVKNSKHFVLC